ncbi:MAG TPA: MmcQ/YjbR family DNA-binding protein [Bacteroidota bacterium]|nr:MmcQ/YjbR family DNA-binding protein [Bacteroidota bacterium]
MPLNLESIRTYCLKKEGRITEEFPFDEVVLVFKVNRKIFILIMTDAHPLTINLKCDPERAIELREQYPAVIPGYHMNKKHWNTVLLDGTIPPKEVYAMIDHSFELIAKGVKPIKRKKTVKKNSR